MRLEGPAQVRREAREADLLWLRAGDKISRVMLQPIRAMAGVRTSKD